MASSKTCDTQNFTSFRKIAQLRAAIKEYVDEQYIDKICKKEGNINYRIESCNSDIHTGKNFSILHFAESNSFRDLRDTLIKNGADFTAKDGEGNTTVHKFIRDAYNGFREIVLDYSLSTRQLLSYHLHFDNISNPRCVYNTSHFHAACMINYFKVVEFFLKNGVTVNETVNENSPFFAGFTPLHFAVEYSAVETVQILLNYGANMRLTNAAGISPLEISIEREINGKMQDNVNKIVLDILLNHHLNNNKNADEFDLSNLHVACIMKDTSIVGNILEKMTDINSINRPLPKNSPICPGYTPLHFAAIFNVDTVKLLINKGADMETKDANGTTPFDLCLQTHEIKDIHYLISSQKRWKDIFLSDNRTKLVDLISAMTSDDELDTFFANFESIADLTIPKDSLLWPGYTVLHVAVVLSELSLERKKDPYYYTGWTKNVNICLAGGADIMKKDVNGWTALHLAFYLQKPHIANGILEYHSGKENPIDSNKISHFHIACTVKNHNAVERFLSNGVVDVNAHIASSIKWPALIRSYLLEKSKFMVLTPGFTALHINVRCIDIKITELLLKNGADIYATDVEDFTPIHRLYGSCARYSTIDILLNINGLRDCTAPGGLTHLHVACRFLHYGAVARLLDNGADINAVFSCYTTNDFHEEGRYFDEQDFGPLKSHLPFASRYNGYTPLHFAMEYQEWDDYAMGSKIQKLLIGRGADLLAGSSSTCVPIETILGDYHEYDELIVSTLVANDNMTYWLKGQIGLTMLHIACYANKLELVWELLSLGEYVNSQVDARSQIWPGDTPLHVVVRNFMKFEDQDDLIEILYLLLDYGADVTLKNESGDNPLQLLSKIYKKPLALSECARLLLTPLKEYDVSVAHSQWMSFFHFACLMKNFPVVEAFIKNGIDMNRPVDLFADRYAGCTPLYLASSHTFKVSSDWTSQLKIVTLLIENGADVHAKDIFDNTPLHNAAKCSVNRKDLFEIFIRCRIDVNANNVYGEIALEVMINSGTAYWEEIEYLLKNGCRINSYNPITGEGYIAKIFNDSVHNNSRAIEDDLIQHLIKSEYGSEVDEKGRTILHNLISIMGEIILHELNFIREDSESVYCELIGQMVNHGFNLNHQDKEGCTALHVAAQFQNNAAVFALLRNGADINITDDEGKPAFEYSIKETPIDPNYSDVHDSYRPEHVKNFVIHISKMIRCGLFVNEVNRRLQLKALTCESWNENLPDEFHVDVRKSKNLKIGLTDMTLYDFGFKIGAEMIYANMPLQKRHEIDKFFANIRKHKLYELGYILKLKYRNAVERLPLIDLAAESFIMLVKNELPILCCRIIVSFLSTGDLKNVIATETL